MEATILLPIISGIGLLFWSDQVKEEHPILSLIFQLMFIPLVFLSVHLGVIEATLTYAADTQLVETLTEVSYYFGWLMFGIGVYYAFIIMGKAKDIVLQKRAEKHQRKYGDE
jgi:hypothetical protein